MRAAPHLRAQALAKVPDAWAAPVGRRRGFALGPGMRGALSLISVGLFVWFVIALIGWGG
jgi:hypothetical protein